MCVCVFVWVGGWVHVCVCVNKRSYCNASSIPWSSGAQLSVKLISCGGLGVWTIQSILDVILIWTGYVLDQLTALLTFTEDTCNKWSCNTDVNGRPFC